MCLWLTALLNTQAKIIKDDLKEIEGGVKEYRTCASEVLETGGGHMVKMQVFNIDTDAKGETFWVLLSDEMRKTVLRISIGQAEANAIYSQLKGQLPPRPITHDLLKLILDGVDAGISKILVRDLKDGTYFERITLEHNGTSREIDSRPSDAISLALRMEATIYVYEEVLQEAGQDSAEFGIEPDDEPLGSSDIIGGVMG